MKYLEQLSLKVRVAHGWCKRQDLGTGPLSGVLFTGLGSCPHVLPRMTYIERV
ncbi:MAG: hypothetical protein ACOYVK_10960 [Bacillota bacterium]